MDAKRIMLKTEHLTKRYGTLTALDQFSLEIRQGEILALVGPNGAGKTTALKLMAGLLAPTHGRVSVAGFDVHRQPLEAKRRFSFIPDQPFLYERLTVEEQLGFIGGVYRMDPSDFQDRVTSLLRLFDLERWRAQRIEQLSYGMRSRLVLIASLLHEPQVLIMDEPFFGLDPQTLRLIKGLLRDRAKEGMTILLSTHQLAVVEDVAHRVAIVHSGRLVLCGRLEDLKSQHGGQRLEDLFFQFTTPPGSGPPADSWSASMTG